MNQLTIPLDTGGTSYAAGDFIVSECNSEAYHRVMQFEGGQAAFGLWLHGPAGSGKTHLAHMWMQQSGAKLLDGNALPSQAFPACAVVDAVHSDTHPEALFHLMNHVKQAGGALLLVSQGLPRDLGWKLKDTLSRLNALDKAALLAPDDLLLEALWYKHLADRQLSVAPEVIAWLMKRAARDAQEVAACVAKLDAAALAEKRSLTVPFVKEILGGA